MINLLPLSTRRRNLWRRRLIQWSVVYVLCAVPVGGLWVLMYNRTNAISSERDELEQRFASLKTLHEEMRDLRRAIDKVGSRGEYPDVGISRLTLLGVVSTSAARTSADLYVERLEFDGSRRAMKLYGVSLNTLSIARFAASLRESGYFSDVRLTSTGVRGGGQANSRTYTIACAF